MAKGKRPAQTQSSPLARYAGVLVVLALAAVLVWWAARPSGEETPVPEASQLGNGPQPLDVGVGPTVENAALVDVPAESLASAGVDVPGGVNVSNDPRLGDPNAPVTIVEFSDFECPYCGDFHTTTFKALRRLYGDQVQWIFVNRFFSAGHPMAEPAARAAECAHQQGRFWEYADLLFENQDRLSPQVLNSYAEVVALNRDAFQSCMQNAETVAELAADQAEGDRVRVDATPMFFVNGRRVTGAQPLSVFNDLLSPYFGR